MNRGMTLIELLVALALSIILSLGLYYSFRYSGIFFSQDKAISDLIEYARTAEEQLKFYFDRWGNGVPEGGTDCTYSFPNGYPKNRFCIIKGSSGNCDEIIFYGNTQGFLIVLDEKDEDEFNALACRMTNDEDDYYYIWKEDKPVDTTTGNRIGVSGGDCGIKGIIPNASVAKEINTLDKGTVTLQTGDAIIRVPKIIKIYCSETNGELYLKVSEQEANKAPVESPLVPVKEMEATLLPEGCDPTNGECTAVRFRITFVNRVGNEEYTLTKDIVLGR
ncbi:PilW family protein [Aquifex aeolicus]|uniref:Uncharacterized protein aq_1436 n=1 Tax=Aquifex aeolicus (strain VF5) TaxID=224324 RepID=Y1436_AQUAE|nr:type II secretion system protein [Aquifex aeolicus]O67427.1 RecName: Full=Uncharacterized protein aq_1436; Flags: Precursor [Aquifex aeolicus VF5]AAC07392.1 putative protein [Aquifex aeolicus VF5]